MINVAQIRAHAAATDGDVVGLSKAQLDELLSELIVGQAAQRQLKLVEATNALCSGGAAQ